MLSKRDMSKLCTRLAARETTALKEAFNAFNEMYFAGKLPKRCPISWKRRRNDYGRFDCSWMLLSAEARDARYKRGVVGVRALMNKEPGKHAVMTKFKITMNPDLAVRREIPYLLTTLIHEMIHLEQASKGVMPRHGKAFDRRYLKLEARLLKKYGHQIVQKRNK